MLSTFCLKFVEKSTFGLNSMSDKFTSKRFYKKWLDKFNQEFLKICS
jgi:hypothetical protein